MTSPKKFLSCLCGCPQLDTKELKRLYLLNAESTFIDGHANKLLHGFLDIENCGEKSESAQFLDIYEKCASFLCQDHILTMDELEQLAECGLAYHLEKDLKTNIQKGQKSGINRSLLRIQRECLNEMEASNSFKRYKEDLLTKLNLSK